MPFHVQKDRSTDALGSPMWRVLDWGYGSPLMKMEKSLMKVLITRPRAQADELAARLRAEGLEPFFFPVIEIRPIDDNVELERALETLNCYEWVVFTSVNAVDVVFDKYAYLFLKNRQAVRVAAIGTKTAKALEARGIRPSFVPDEYVAEAIVAGLGNLRGKWVLLPRAEIARADLSEAIVRAGGIAHAIPVYQTLPARPDPDGLAALKVGVDVITYTSASTVRNFVAIARESGLDPLHLPNNPAFACIGPITEQAARESGLRKLIVAREYTSEGLSKAILRWKDSQR